MSYYCAKCQILCLVFKNYLNLKDFFKSGRVTPMSRDFSFIYKHVFTAKMEKNRASHSTGYLLYYKIIVPEVATHNLMQCLPKKEKKTKQRKYKYE